MGIDGHRPKSETRIENSRLWWPNCIASHVCTILFVLRTVAREASCSDMRHAAFYLLFIPQESLLRTFGPIA